MSEAVHDHHPGDQDISEQLATFSLFGKLMKWGGLSIVVLVLMLTLWFCVGAGFWAGAVAGVIVAAVGVYFLRSPPGEAH